MDPSTEHIGALYQNEESVPFSDHEGTDADMANIPDGAPERADRLVREFY
ncbi:hypothetical protein [Halorhabdus sp. CUG00001]|nr:hypothetical protein [Halorhabdus sp. CUG00001]